MTNIKFNSEIRNSLSISNNIPTANVEQESIIQRVWQHAAKNGDRVALSGTDEQYTYSQLKDNVSAIAHWIDTNIATPKGSVIAICMERSPHYLCAILGVWASGRAILPIDPQTPLNRINGMIAAAGAEHILVEDKLFEGLEQSCKQTSLDRITKPSPKLKYSPHLTSPDELAYVLFTSGSTGTPKGAQIEHWGMNNNILNKIVDFNITTDSAVAQNASQSFDVSIWQGFAALYAGGETYIIEDKIIENPVNFLKTVSSKKIDVLEIVPTYLSLIVEVMEIGTTPHLDRLHHLVLTGEAVSLKNIKKFREYYPHVKIANAYGPTEASDDITHYVINETQDIPLDVPLGTALPNFAIFICDDELNVLRHGEIGEIVVVGNGVCRGYCNPPIGVDSPFFSVSIDGLYTGRGYRTGDLGTMDSNGFLFFHGRKDRQTKINGMRTELGEIEHCLETVPGVTRAAVLLSGSDESGYHLTGFVTSTTKIDYTSAIEVLKNKLPPHMVPTNIIHLDSFDTLPSGKINYHSLKNYLENEKSIPQDRPTFSDAEQERYWSVLEKVLGSENIDQNKDFLSCGGDSFKAIRITALFGPKAEVSDLYTDLTLLGITKLTAAREFENSIPISELYIPDSATSCVLCVPNSGGDPVAFYALSDYLSKQAAGVAILGAKIQRATIENFSSDILSDYIERCVDYLEDNFDMPTVIYGQCNGSSLAIAITRELENRGRTDIKLLIGSALPRAEATPTDTRSDEEIVSFLKGLGSILPESDEDLLFFLEDFRYDVHVAGHIYNMILSESDYRLKSKIYCMAGDIDPLFKGRFDETKSWSDLGTLKKVSIINGAGHFLHRDAPEAVSKFIVEALADA